MLNSAKVPCCSLGQILINLLQEAFFFQKDLKTMLFMDL